MAKNRRFVTGKDNIGKIEPSAATNHNGVGRNARVRFGDDDVDAAYEFSFSSQQEQGTTTKKKKRKTTAHSF